MGRSQRSSRRRHRVVGRLAGLTVLVLLPLVASLVWILSPDEAPDHTAELAAALTASGEAADVIECALRLAADDLRLGPLDPVEAAELVETCRAARRALAFADPDESDGDAVVREDQPDTLGDDPHLDELWVACGEGSGAACDRLFTEAPVGSAYETFGLSCGDRPDVLHCSELDLPTDPSA